MNWWQRWKAKHWEGEYIPGERMFPMGHWSRPPLRRVALWFARHWREQPLGLLGAIAGLIAAVAGLLGGIAALIQALRP